MYRSIKPLGGTLTDVQRLRVKQGLTVKGLAEAAKVSHQTVERMESTEWKGRFHIESASRVARALNTPFEDVFRRTEVNYTQGRMPQTGVPTHTRPIQIIVLCPTCTMQASERERIDGTCEKCEAKLAA